MNEKCEAEQIRQAMDRTLSGLPEDPELERRILAANAGISKRSAPRMKLLLIPALALCLLAGAFAAERSGLYDMLLASPQSGVLPEAAQLVDTPVTLHAVQSKHAALQVTQILRSGSDVLLLIEAAPRMDGILLTPDLLLGSAADSSACRALMGFDAEAEDALLTHAENADKQLVALDVHLHAPARSGNSAVLEYRILDGKLLENGSIHLLLCIRDEAFAAGAEVSLQLRFGTTPVTRSEPAPDYALQRLYAYDSMHRSPAWLTLSLPAPAAEADEISVNLPPLIGDAAALPVNVSEAGVLINGVSLIRTPLYTRFEVEYTCLFSQEEMADREVFFLLSDAEGNWHTGGLRGGSVSRGSWPTFTRTGYASALPALPEDIWLTVMAFDSAEPLAHVRIPVVAAESGPST